MGSGDGGGGSSDACNIVLCNMLRVEDDPFDLSEAFSWVSENTDSLLGGWCDEPPVQWCSPFSQRHAPSCA